MTKIVAAIQLNSSDDVAANLARIEHWVGDAKSQDAELVLLPENCAFMGKQQSDAQQIAEPLVTADIDKASSSPLQARFATIAAKHQLWLVVGALPTLDSNGNILQTQLVYDERGRYVSHYHKRHLFDVTLPNEAESYRESDVFSAGDAYCVIDSPIGYLGLAICYDLRFPEQFRALIDRGAQVLVLPAAFTYHTGKAHWELLLRARAVENQSYVIASAQCGQHASGRQTWGHSMIINPWGKVMDCLPTGEGVIVAAIDLSAQKKQRTVFPALAHRIA